MFGEEKISANFQFSSPGWTVRMLLSWLTCTLERHSAAELNSSMHNFILP